MRKTILLSVLVGSCAILARANNAYPLKESSQDFEGYSVGTDKIYEEKEYGYSYWWASEASEPTTVVTSGAGENYLKITADQGTDGCLIRTMYPRDEWTVSASNAFVSVAGEDGYDGLYCDLRTSLHSYGDGEEPELDALDNIVLWTRSDGFHVTAGRFNGDLRVPESHDYLVQSPVIENPGSMHRVTIRVIPDIATGAKALGFEIWVDEQRVRLSESVFVDIDTALLSSEARAMSAAGCLIPARTAPGSDKSVSLTGVAFSGSGNLSKIAYTRTSPASWAKESRVFTLRWDAGVKTLSYRIDGGASVTVSDIARRSVDFEIPEGAVGVAVTAVYDTANGFSQGVWTAEGSCTVASAGSFACDASSEPGTGFVRSARDEIGIGGAGGFYTFEDAKRQAKSQGVDLIVLNDDFCPPAEDNTGSVLIEQGEEFTIDLHGHVISNRVGQSATIVNRGKLTIIDTVGGGRVAPAVGVDAGLDFERLAIYSETSKRATNVVLTIKGGVYDGEIAFGGSLTNNGAVYETDFTVFRDTYTADQPRFADAVGEDFPYADNLDDGTLFFLYEDSYWRPYTNAFMWCGKGADAKWSNPDNWKGGVVPGAGDYVIFPSHSEPWELDMETGFVCGDILFAGDVIAHGTNDFTSASWIIPASGRIAGDATLVWNGSLPPDLTTLLAESWKGRVEIVDVGDSSPKLLTDLLTWGNDGSEVVFRGVRGYYHKTDSITVPYTLRLENGTAGYAWKNDAGFTGGIVVFPKLVGGGDLISPKNSIANRQLFVFRDVLDYTGVMDVQGKRVLLGPGEAVTAEAGSITWSDGLAIKPVATYSCRIAAFGGSMDVFGAVGDSLAVYTGSTVGDGTEVVNIRPAGTLAELCVTNPVGTVKIAAWSEDAVLVDGRRVSPDALLSANSLTSIRMMSADGAKRLNVAGYYDKIVSTNEDRSITVRLSLNQEAIPVIGAKDGESADIKFADGMVSIIVSKAVEGLWYGLEFKATLADEWPDAPYIWSTRIPGADDRVELVAPAEGESGFYRVVVTDVNPEVGK